MDFRITGLETAPFTRFFGLSEAALLAEGARGQISTGSFPCRITLDEVPEGLPCILLNHPNQTAPHSPYRGSGPIYVREGGGARYDRINTVPTSLRNRVLSLRAYDAEGMMVDAEVIDGRELEGLLARLLAGPDTAYVHAHNAKRGCYACRIDRA